MQELIQIQKSKGGRDVVSARELHGFLEVKTDLGRWIERRVKKYGFTEHHDFVKVSQKCETSGGSQEVIDFALTLDMAKELAMVEGNERGKQARQYFIACERMLKTIATPPAHQLPKTFSEALRMLAEKVDSEERLLKENAELKPKAEYMDNVLNSVSDQTTTLVAKSLGLSAIRLNQILVDKKIQYRVDGSYALYQRYASKGYAAYRTRHFIDNETGQTKTKTYLVWTESGKAFIHQLLNPHLSGFNVSHPNQQAQA